MFISIKPFEIHDGDGIRSTLFFKGCPLKCKWCHNPEAIDTKPQLSFDGEKCVACGNCQGVCRIHRIKNGIHEFKRNECSACGKCVNVCPVHALKLYGMDFDYEKIVNELMEDKIFFESSGGGVTISGGEPLMQIDACEKILKILKRHGINTAVDTCGYASKENIDRILPYTDTFLYDIKAIDEDVHIKCTGKSNKIILENLKYIDSKNKRIEIRIPFIPNENLKELENIGEFILTLKNVVRVRVLPYHSLGANKYRCLGMDYSGKDIPVPTNKETDNAVTTLRNMGINAMRSED